MSQDKTIKNPYKKEPIEQSSNNMYVLQKFKGYHEINRRKEFLIKWQVFPHSKSTFEPEEIFLI